MTFKDAMERHEYYVKNKERESTTNKIWYEIHFEEMQLYKKQYTEKNKDQINTRKQERIKCECGCVVARNHLSEHRKTKKHTKHLDNGERCP